MVTESELARKHAQPPLTLLPSEDLPVYKVNIIILKYLINWLENTEHWTSTMHSLVIYRSGSFKGAITSI